MDNMRIKTKSGTPRTTAAKPTREGEAACRVWHADDWSDCQVGYLVTEPGDINRPIAFVSSVEGSRADAFELACKIARDPEQAWRCGTLAEHRVDLTTYGMPDSDYPMPTFVYALRCRPINENQWGDDNPDVDLDRRPVEPRPWCRFLAADLRKSAPDEKEVRHG